MERMAAREASLMSQDHEESRSPCSDFWKLLPAGKKFLSSRSGLFVFPPDRRKLLCNIQEVTFIRLNSISKIKSMEKQILVLDGKCWH